MFTDLSDHNEEKWQFSRNNQLETLKYLKNGYAIVTRL